ncbi:hypothetical protein GCM10023115_07290 [Pontixanthobacter gangjinensis]|uniref:Uncharacterized protein n=1 Tax=Pontixanthobacter gangjinensis TaxID=1028742 RepID=A0A6I4SLE2_9SPHN|nr:hypothetical protein [Pontixanthobacter gangjinensis]MXO55976.1 hypothetical protein [Pontixanthobacter gangjinensis]
MRKLTIIAAAAAMLAAPALGAQEQNSGEVAGQTRGEIKLAEMLEGRIAGEPQSCIRMMPSTDLTVIDGTALVYKSGRTLYVNVTDNPASIDEDDTMVRRTSFASRLCNTDIITKIDRFHGGYTGNVNLGLFIPYRKAS